LVERCGSFLTLRNETIFFIHQLAKDYLPSGNGRKVLRWDQVEEHGKTTSQSLNILSKTLKREICGLHKPGTLTSEVRERVVEESLLRIACAYCYWVYHLSDHLAGPSHARLDSTILSDGGTVYGLRRLRLTSTPAKVFQLNYDTNQTTINIDAIYIIVHRGHG